MRAKDLYVECRTLANDLLAVALGEALPTATARVGRHADRCARCAHEFDAYRTIVEAIPTIDTFNPDEREEALALRRLHARVAELTARQLRFGVFPTLYGRLLLARSTAGIAWVQFVTGNVADRDVHAATGMEAVHDPSALEPLAEQLKTYWSRRGTSLDWPLDFRLARSSFQRRVLQLTRRVPNGAVVSFEALARLARSPRAAAAVARALYENPLPIAVPCHRVIGSDGTLGRYASGGARLKRRLLLAEGLPVVKARTDEGTFVDSRRTYARAPGDRSYCLPTCRSLARLRPGSATLFATRDDAEAAGLRPCTTCRPDRRDPHRSEPTANPLIRS
jgi:O-6-methylguanine DNA methyltransferase